MTQHLHTLRHNTHGLDRMQLTSRAIVVAAHADLQKVTVTYRIRDGWEHPAEPSEMIELKIFTLHEPVADDWDYECSVEGTRGAWHLFRRGPKP